MSCCSNAWQWIAILDHERVSCRLSTHVWCVDNRQLTLSRSRMAIYCHALMSCWNREQV